MAVPRDHETTRIDWLVFNLRWLVLAAAALVLFVADRPTIPDMSALGALGALVLFNIGLTLLEFFEFWHRLLPGITLVADSLLCLSLFVATGGVTSPLLWIGLFPGLTAALRHRWYTALALVGVFLLSQAVLASILNADDPAWPARLSAVAAVLLPATALAAFFGGQMRRLLRAAFRREQQARARQAQSLRKHARAIYDMASMVSATLDYEKVLDAALNFGALGAEGQPLTSSEMVCAVLLFEEEKLRVGAAWRLPPADSRVICPGREGVLAQVIRSGEPQVIQDPDRDLELQQFVGFRACRSLMALPLRVGFETYGVVVYAHPQPDFFDDDQRAFFNAMVNQAIIALQNARLYQNLRQEKERLVEVQEEANKKLARDLHDGPTQAVAALAMRANFARRLLERDGKAAGEELFKMEDLARRTTKEIRHMLFTLRPLVLESQGLAAALRQLAEKMRDTHGQNVIVEADPSVEERLEKNQQGVLFYITEEAVNNARKHAQAEHIWVRLKASRDMLTLEIQDDGVGFNVGAVDAEYDRRGSLGMVNMRERAEILSGAVKIDSAEGKGTRITVLVPLSES
ncbi:MAG: GAF domain-containing sensor histidine kinase [Anaerolineales bacterium]|nr:GAF domain-containing sensor histidine kinase [Anaerolineales bacterium]